MNYNMYYHMNSFITAHALSTMRFAHTLTVPLLTSMLVRRSSCSAAKAYNGSKSNMREAIGKLTFGPKSRTGILYIPSDLMVDSAFPFQPPVNLKVRIEGERLIVERVQ